jgi:hypothetical protein
MEPSAQLLDSLGFDRTSDSSGVVSRRHVTMANQDNSILEQGHGTSPNYDDDLSDGWPGNVPCLQLSEMSPAPNLNQGIFDHHPRDDIRLNLQLLFGGDDPYGRQFDGTHLPFMHSKNNIHGSSDDDDSPEEDSSLLN